VELGANENNSGGVAGELASLATVNPNCYLVKAMGRWVVVVIAPVSADYRMRTRRNALDGQNYWMD